MTTSGIFYTGDNTIDALTSGQSWNAAPGMGVTINYTLNATLSSGTAMSSAMATIAERALQAWANVADITLNRVENGSANFSFGLVNGGSDPNNKGEAKTYQYGSGGFYDIDKAGVELNSYYYNNAASLDPNAANSGYYILLHEIGHTLGLKHAGHYNSWDYGPYLPKDLDSNAFTVMSYHGSGVKGDINNDLGILDIQAVQHLYGANHSFNAGATTYSYNGTGDMLETIWDGGGIDTLDVSGAKKAVIDLREGVEHYNVINGKQYVGIAYGANIENAVGTKGADTMYGSSLANCLNGGAGNDTIYGGNGNDTLTAGAGNNTVYGGSGNDRLVGDAGNDTLNGDAGNDVLLGGAGKNALNGGDGNDKLTGGAGTDIYHGGTGNDVVYASAGKDSLYGDAGNDNFVFATGILKATATIYDFEGEGVSGGDVLSIDDHINGKGYATAADVANAIVYKGTTGTLDLGGGSKLVLVGLDHHLTAGDIKIF